MSLLVIPGQFTYAINANERLFVFVNIFLGEDTE